MLINGCLSFSSFSSVNQCFISSNPRTLYMGNQSSHSHTQEAKMKGRVQWNEANLREIEANKPVRKKIDEPKTPFPPMIEEYGSPSSSQDNSAKAIGYAAHAEVLRHALNELALSGEKHKCSSGRWTPSDEEGETGDDNQGFAKHRDVLSFEERRRAHYDEFKKVKEIQEKTCSLDDGSDNGIIRNSGSCSTFNTEEKEIEIEDSDTDIILQIIDIEENDDLSFPQ